MDSYLLYASSSLVVMGVVALVLAVVFRLRFRRLRVVSGGSVASVFNRTFVVFDPYEQKTVFHRFLSFLPFVPLVCGFGVAVLLFVIINSGLLLTLLVSMLALSLIVVEEAPEAYAESRGLMRAIEGGSDLGVGDVRLLELTKGLLPRLSFYYLGLGVLLFGLAAVLPFVWAQFLFDFAMFFGYLISAGGSAGQGGLFGVAGPWVVIGLYALVITFFIVLVTLAKGRLFGYYSEALEV